MKNRNSRYRLELLRLDDLGLQQAKRFNRMSESLIAPGVNYMMIKGNSVLTFRTAVQKHRVKRPFPHNSAQM